MSFRRRVRMGSGVEFDVIRSFLPGGGDLPPEVLVGPGDDCAVLDGGRWAVTCDMSLEDVHFRRDWLAPAEIGFRAAAAALSDLAAVAARPVALLVALAAPRRDAKDGTALAIHRGLAEAARLVGAAVVGGDVTRSPGPLVLDVTALGRVDAPVLRHGARPGDEVWVTGHLGASGAAVRLMGRGQEPEASVRGAYARPVPRIREALWLAERGVPHCLIDLSDGLGGDAGHLAAASGVSLVLEAAAIPVAAGARQVATDGDDALSLALGAGEDYELCFTAAPGALADLAGEFESRFSVPLSRVGRVHEGEGVLLDRGDGEPRPLPAGGWDHFAAEGRA